MSVSGTDLESILDRFFLDYNLQNLKKIHVRPYSHPPRNLVHWIALCKESSAFLFL